jgi:hypothetical protein
MARKAGKPVYALAGQVWITSEVMLTRGEAWDGNDRIVKDHPDYFSPTPVDVRTSAVGEIGSGLPWAPPQGDRVVWATFSTWVTPTVQVTRGEAWDAEDGVVKSHLDWFSPVPLDLRTSGPAGPGSRLPWEEAHIAPPVEEATAAPGEKRTITKGRTEK